MRHRTLLAAIATLLVLPTVGLAAQRLGDVKVKSSLSNIRDMRSAARDSKSRDKKRTEAKKQQGGKSAPCCKECPGKKDKPGNHSD